MPIVNEGEFGWAQGGKNLIYPNINSCLTLTLVNGTEAIGAHAVAVPGQGQLSFNKLVDEMSNLKLKPTRVYVIGDTVTWQQNINALSKNNVVSLWQLGAVFGLPEDDFENIEVFDVAPLTKGGGMVNINVHPATRTIRVTSKDAALLKTFSWA